MLLTKSSIQKEIELGNIKTEPLLDQDQIREVSIDLKLGNVFRTYAYQEQPIDLVESADYRTYTTEIVAESFTLAPLQTILGMTLEKITLPGNICGWLEGRSRFARMGLLIHISAGLIQPGISNHQVLEITNLSSNHLILHAGEKICQLAFQRCEGTAFYEGKFQGQTKP